MDFPDTTWLYALTVGAAVVSLVASALRLYDRWDERRDKRARAEAHRRAVADLTPDAGVDDTEAVDGLADAEAVDIEPPTDPDPDAPDLEHGDADDDAAEVDRDDDPDADDDPDRGKDQQP